MTHDHDATYSPDDNKLRIYPAYRFARSDYDRLRAAGYKWAPKQELFVAPMWTPHREDIAIEFAGDVGDEDTSLVERAEERAERFDGYSDARRSDARSARAGVDAIASGIPFGQPILVGHHSEKRARKDAARIDNGMRRSLKMWDTANYWAARAEGAISSAKYKETPAVRSRRIKRLKADLRKVTKEQSHATKYIDLWTAGEITRESALAIANHGHISWSFSLEEYPRDLPISQYEGSMSLWSAIEDGVVTPEQARDIAVPAYERGISNRLRWVEHYTNRIAYESALLEESGGIAATNHNLKVGGKVKAICTLGVFWLTILRINKSGGEITSVSTDNKSWPRIVKVEKITDYQPPADNVPKPTKPPLCNYRRESAEIENMYHPGEFYTAGQLEMTKAEWAKIYRDNKGTKLVDGTHRMRYVSRMGTSGIVFLTDQKETLPPKRAAAKTPGPKRDDASTIADLEATAAARERYDNDTEAREYDNLRHSLRSGNPIVKSVSAPQLFATPEDLAYKVVSELGRVHFEHRILEPSAGTGSLLAKLPDGADVTAVEINLQLVDSLRDRFPEVDVRCGDFLECNGDLGTFDRIVMNPPFGKTADIKHVLHARKMLNAGGILVSVVANGPRQRKALEPLADAWVDLPSGSFKNSGTNVNAAIVVISAESE